MWSTKGLTPFEELAGLQYEMNRLFNNYGVDYKKFPAVNIFSNEDEVIVSAEIPGLNKDDFNVTVYENNIIIEGERKYADPDCYEAYHRQERGSGKFTRSFRLPYEVESEKVSAKYADGILTVTLPRIEESKPRKIKVSVEK